MGDRRRFHEVAEFVLREFPPDRFRAVADVAGGYGKLSGELLRRGYASSTVIDTRRKRRHPRGVVRLSQPFVAGMARHYDLLVGLHPDGATEALVEAARKRPVVIVPCCLHDWAGPEEGDVEDRIRARWERMGLTWREIELPIRGKNLAMVCSTRISRPDRAPTLRKGPAARWQWPPGSCRP